MGHDDERGHPRAAVRGRGRQQQDGLKGRAAGLAGLDGEDPPLHALELRGEVGVAVLVVFFGGVVGLLRWWTTTTTMMTVVVVEESGAMMGQKRGLSKAHRSGQ